jgi:hypothetical protein
MKNPTLAAPSDPVLLFIAAGWLAAEALAVLLIAALALLLTLAGWRPAGPAPALAPSPSPAPSPAPVAALERLRVVELRVLARAAGFPRLARSGRRAELLQALAAAPLAGVDFA